MDKNKEMTSILEELLELQKFEDAKGEIAEPVFTNDSLYSIFCC